MDVLVTGGTGSIGAWVTRELVSLGHHPIVFDVELRRRFLDDLDDEISFVEGDVTDYESVAGALADYGVDRIAHLAKILPQYSEQRPVLALRVNVCGTGNVLKAAAEAGIRRVVFSSSKSVFAAITGEYGPPSFEPLHPDYPKFERDSPDHVPFYTVTNKMVEYFGIRYARARDLDLVITRFGSTWGPGKLETQRDVYDESPQATGGWLICRMIESAASGRPVTVDASRTKTDNAVYTKDVAAGVARAVLSDEIAFDDNHREFLIDAGRVLDHRDFGDALEERFPGFEFIVRGDEGGPASHRGGVTCRFDLSRTHRELGYEPQYAEPIDAIDDYLETLDRFGPGG